MVTIDGPGGPLVSDRCQDKMGTPDPRSTGKMGVRVPIIMVEWGPRVPVPKNTVMESGGRRTSMRILGVAVGGLNKYG